MKTVEVNVDELEFDETIEDIFGAANISAHPDLPESFKEDDSIGTVPVFRVVKGKKKCFAGRKFVEYAKQAGLKKILAQRIDGDDFQTVQRAIKSNTTKHGAERIMAKMVAYLYEKLTDGPGCRNDLKKTIKDNNCDVDPDLVPDGDNENQLTDATAQNGTPKAKRNPTVYDKIGPMLGISPKKAQMLKVILEQIPAYFDNMERERCSVYEAYSKCKKEKEGYEPNAPTEKPAVNTTDTTGVPKFSPGDPTYNVNAVYDFVENESGDTGTKANTGGKKKIVATTKIVYVTQTITCVHCGDTMEIVIPKTEPDEQ